jgi:hypothetical protein
VVDTEGNCAAGNIGGDFEKQAAQQARVRHHCATWAWWTSGRTGASFSRSSASGPGRVKILRRRHFASAALGLRPPSAGICSVVLARLPGGPCRRQFRSDSWLQLVMAASSALTPTNRYYALHSHGCEGGPSITGLLTTTPPSSSGEAFR